MVDGVLPGWEENICPECENGKHVNCTTETLNAADEMVPCTCDKSECGA